MTKLSNTEAELKKKIAYKKNVKILKNNSAVCRSGYLHGVNQSFPKKKLFVFKIESTSLKYIKKEIIHYYENISKSTLKYPVYCQVIWVKVRRLQDQCISI